MKVVDPGHLGGAEHFAGVVSGVLGFVRGCPRAEGVDEIILPGDPERRILKEKLAQGIALDDGNWEQLVKLAEKWGVDVPV